MKPISCLQVACQCTAHPLLNFRGQRPTEVRINSSHHRERIATDLSVIHVTNATFCQSISFPQESIQRVRPIIDRLAANSGWIDRIAKYAAKDRYETGYRGHGIERCSMCLDEKRIRINRQQSWQGKHMRGGLEHPTPRVLPDLQMLKKTAVIVVCRSQILAKEPGPIRRDIIHRIELVTHGRRRHETDTFLRKLCTNGVHLAKCRRQPVEAITTANCPLNSSLLIIASRWGGRHDFPHERNEVLGIRREQSVQHGGTAAWQTDDEERFANLMSHD